jgi:UDP-N-acetyl-2-amino-2-deoxyglucuronate dehydrogenase
MKWKLNLKKAEVMWELSTDGNRLPDKVKEIGQSAYRSIQIDGEEIEFTSGFTDLHKQSYQRIIDGQGFRAVEAMPSIALVHNMMECN